MQQPITLENASGMDIVIVDVCQGEQKGCPNLLIATSDWKRAVEEWLRAKDVPARLRARIPGGKVLHHQKLRIAIAGCPNSCSRPQIADIGLVGYVRPAVVPEECLACGLCEAACPDAAITIDGGPPVFDATACQGCVRCRIACPASCINLSRPGVRVFLGGKLGRHPRLAQAVAEMIEPAEVIALLDHVVNEYVECAEPEERFSDYLFRAHTMSEVSHG